MQYIFYITFYIQIQTPTCFKLSSHTASTLHVPFTGIKVTTASRCTTATHWLPYSFLLCHVPFTDHIHFCPSTWLTVYNWPNYILWCKENISLVLVYWNGLTFCLLKNVGRNWSHQNYIMYMYFKFFNIKHPASYTAGQYTKTSLHLNWVLSGCMHAYNSHTGWSLQSVYSDLNTDHKFSHHAGQYYFSHIQQSL